MSVVPILTAARTAVAGTPGLKEAHYPPPRGQLNQFPCAVIEWTGSTNRLASSFEGELGVAEHRFRVIVLAGAGYHPEHGAEAAALFDAMGPILDADPTLGGVVTHSQWESAAAGKVSYANQDHTGFLLNVVTEDK